MIRRILPLLALAGLAAAGCTLAGDITPPPGANFTNPGAPVSQPTASVAPLQIPDRLPDLSNGEAIYAQRCEPCHGPKGLGGGSQAADLPNEPAMLGQSELARAAVPRSWYEVVTEGRIDQFMPGFASLSDAERWDVVGYSLTLSIDSEALSHAEEVYAQECADCHGPSGQGAGQGPALARPDLLAGNSRADLYQVISDGLAPGMPSYADSLPESARWALAAYLQTLSGGQSGESQIEPSDELLPDETPLAGSIVGQVINGTPGASAPGGLEVTLHGFDGQQEVVSQIVETDAQGGYRFDELEIVAGRLFIISVEYTGIRYASEVLHLGSADEPLDLPVTVFESTTDPSAIRADQIHVLLDFPRPDSVRVIELWVLRNLGDRTLAHSSEGGGIEIPLPAGAENLRFEDSLFAERYEAAPGGFTYAPALRPGDNGIQIVFSFDLPYPRSLDFRQDVPYDVSMVTILAPEIGPAVSAPGLVDRGPRQVTGQVVHQYNIDLESGQPLAFAIRGRAPGDSILPQGVDPELLIGAAAFLAVIVGLALWMRPWRRQDTGRSFLDDDGAPLEVPADERRRLVAMIAELDEALEAGELDEAEHQVRRTSLKTELLNLMKETQGS